MLGSFLNFLVVSVLVLQALSFAYANATNERGLKVRKCSIPGVIVNDRANVKHLNKALASNVQTSANVPKINCLQILSDDGAVMVRLAFVL